MIYGELGRPPRMIQIKQRIANFWIKLAKGTYSKLSVIMYKLLLNLNNNSGYEIPWIKLFKIFYMNVVFLAFGIFLMPSITNCKIRERRVYCSIYGIFVRFHFS